MNKHFLSRRVLRFRRFARKAFAAFRSLHREVTIGHVGRGVADMELRKAGKAAVLLSVLLCSPASPVLADNDDAPDRLLSVQEVLVVANQTELQSDAYRLVTTVTREQLNALPVSTLTDVLQYIPGLDLRRRGANDAQADLSMRSGTFDQVLILLNGVPINDSHTGHYSLNLPLSTLLIDRIELLQGTAVTLSGTNAFAGAVNIVTRNVVPTDGKTAPANDLRLRMTAGTNALLHPALAACLAQKDWQINISGDYLRSDGYTAPSPSAKEAEALANNDMRVANLFFETRWRDLHLQVGAQYKNAGAGLFYGGSTDQFDATRTAFASAQYTHHWGAWSVKAQASYRANYDRYEWHRGQRLYGNFHFSQNTTAALHAHYASYIGTTTFGIELLNENIHSTNLGDTLYPNGQVPNIEGFDLRQLDLLHLTKGKNRLNLKYCIQQTFHYEHLNASFGIAGNYNTSFGHQFSGAANIGYEYLPNSSVYANAQRAVRYPTFTDLYYDAGNQLGDRHLQPETAWTFSLGATYNKQWQAAQTRHNLHLSADTYYRLGQNIIDWVYTPSDTRRPYHATNQQKVNGAGLELNASYHHDEWLRMLSLSYAYSWLYLDLHEAQSRYLDYLSHKLVLCLQHGIWVSDSTERIGVLGASWHLRWQKREGDFTSAEGLVTPYTPVLLLDAELFWQNERLKVSADITNITNRHYYDYGALLMPGTQATLSIDVKL